MNKGEFVELVADKMGDSKAGATRAVDMILDCLAAAIKKEKKVALSGFGIFEVKNRKARDGINPLTKAPIKIKASKSVGFKPAKTFKESL